jgi:hypothetical protein
MSTSRRTLLGASAAMLAIGATAAAAGAAAPHPDADLLAACRDFHAVEAEIAEWNASTGWSDERGAAVLRRWYDAIDRVGGIHPKTDAGRLAKARAAYAAMMNVSRDNDLESEEWLGMMALGGILGIEPPADDREEPDGGAA